MRVPLAILFSVCVIVGLGQLVQTNATVTEVPVSAFVMDVAPIDLPATTSAAKVEVKINNELPTPPPIFTPPLVPPANDVAYNGSCPRCPNYQPSVNVPAPCDPVQTAESGQGGRGRPVLGLVGGAVRSVGCLAGVGRRAARRAARRG